jgi:hypothetical protein
MDMVRVRTCVMTLAALLAPAPAHAADGTIGLGAGHAPDDERPLASLAALVPMLFASPTMAQPTAAEALTRFLGPKVITGCQQELTRYCDTVTPGEGRLLACLFAHEDKLSGRCEYALYDASAQLERVIAAIAHVASACKTDIAVHCAKVEMGEGRIAPCLEAAGDKVRESCRQALQDTALR